jgi:antitoxin VapB
MIISHAPLNVNIGVQIDVICQLIVILIFFRLYIFLDKIYILVYTNSEVIFMTTAKIFPNGQSQAVRLPKGYRFSQTEVGITRIGEMVVLYPIDRSFEIFSAVSPVTDDFEEAILSARENEMPTPPRIDL